VTQANPFRDVPLGLFVLTIPQIQALPWADLWLARWAETQTELHSGRVRKLVPRFTASRRRLGEKGLAIHRLSMYLNSYHATYTQQRYQFFRISANAEESLSMHLTHRFAPVVALMFVAMLSPQTLFAADDRPMKAR